MKWIKIKELCPICNIEQRSIRKRIYNGFYGKEGIGFRYNSNKYGKYIEINIDYLPEEIKEKYLYGENVLDLAPDIEEFEEYQRMQAEQKAEIVKKQIHSQKSVPKYLEAYNKKYGTNISNQQLWRWKKKYLSGGIDALIDNRGGHNRGNTTIPEDAWEYFYDIYMTQQQRTVQLCYDLTKKKFPNIPHVSTFQRRVAKIPRYLIIKKRIGEHALCDHLPSMERSKLDIFSNDIWFSDHHKMDVFVKGSTGKLKRLWLTTFFDARSNKIVGFTAREAYPDADVIKQTLRQAIEQYGVPKELYFDNGKDYRSKSFDKDFDLSLVRKLGIKMIYAKPYHGQAKTVERFFKTLEERFSKQFPTYTGKDAKNRPECMRVSNDKILAIAPEKADFVDYLAEYMDEYNNTASKGADMDNKSPNEVYTNHLIDVRKMSDDEAIFLLFGKTEKRTIHKNGITIFNNSYWNDKLIRYYGDTVMVCFDPMNLSRAYIYDEKGNKLCIAEAQIRTPFRHTTAEDYKEAERRRQLVRQFIKEYEPAGKYDIYNEISQRHLEEKKHRESLAEVEPVRETTKRKKPSADNRPKPNNDIALIGFDNFLKKTGGD